MATSKITFDYPTSVNLGGIAAINEKDFLRQIADIISDLPQNTPRFFQARYNGHFYVYGSYDNNGDAVWFMASAASHLYSVLKQNGVYSYYRQDFTAM